MPDFLLEIGTEEIPARMIDAASQELSRRVTDLLARERLADGSSPESLSTPRRLSLVIRDLAPRQPDVTEQLTGPPIKAAFKDGQPTPAAHAFAKRANVDVSALQRVTTPKGEYLTANVTTPGRSASDVLRDQLPREIAALYWPKNMYWRAGKAERFVRPIRWIVALLDDEVIPLEFAGIAAGRESRGHRILSTGTVKITKPADYTEALRKASVIVSAEQRREFIHSALQNALRTPALKGRGFSRADQSSKKKSALAAEGEANDQRPTTNDQLRFREDKDLLSTVVNLTEFPSVILGSFDREFLALPEEVLVTVMRDHQKYFAVEDSNGKLAPHFLAVLNTDRDPDGLIRHGNERVLRARFNDARFFWQTDQKIPLRDRVEMLKAVTFQKDLGSYYEKTIRVQKLASLICESLKGAGVKVRPGIVHKAALLAKTDLTTELVKEFTELQGIVGGLYARVQQLDPLLNDEQRSAIGTTIYDHYKPESMEDSVPRTVEGAVLSIADKADSIAGMFALGLVPSGSKDPFALRRQANGIVKSIAEHKLPLSLAELMRLARLEYVGSRAEAKFTAGEDPFTQSSAAFFRERLEFYLRDVLGCQYDVVNAVLAVEADDVVSAVARAAAVAEVRPTENFTSISTAFKRMKNILRQAREKKIQVRDGNAVDLAAQLKESAEQALANTATKIAPRFSDYRQRGDYRAALKEMAQLRAPIDQFFDKVMVMVDDPALRSARLALLNSLVREFSTIADFSEIVTEKTSS